MLWYALPAESVRAETFGDARKLGIKSSTDHTPSPRHSPNPKPSPQCSSTGEITSSFWANTTQAWSGTAQTDQRTVSSSTPGIWHYYSQPGLAGNVSFTGPLTFVLYLVSSSGTGGGTVITANVNKITSTGAVIPLAVGSLSGTPISTTLASYTITLTSNTYQIETGAIFDFQATVTVGGSTARTIAFTTTLRQTRARSQSHSSREWEAPSTQASIRQEPRQHFSAETGRRPVDR